MNKIYLLISICIISFSCKVSSSGKPSKDLIYIQIDTLNTSIKNGYLSIEANVINNSNDTILLLKPKSSFNEKIDYFSINLNQGDTKGCSVETFELQAPRKQSYRFLNHFIKINPNTQTHIRLNGRLYDQIIYCQDSRPIELQIQYNAIKFNGKNSLLITNNYINVEKKQLFVESVEKFSNLYDKEIKSDITIFIPNRN